MRDRISPDTGAVAGAVVRAEDGRRRALRKRKRSVNVGLPGLNGLLLRATGGLSVAIGRLAVTERFRWLHTPALIAPGERKTWGRLSRVGQVDTPVYPCEKNVSCPVCAKQDAAPPWERNGRCEGLCLDGQLLRPRAITKSDRVVGGAGAVSADANPPPDPFMRKTNHGDYLSFPRLLPHSSAWRGPVRASAGGATGLFLASIGDASGGTQAWPRARAR